MKKIVRFLILLTVVSLSCNFLTGGTGFTEINGPILAVVPAASLDEVGEIVNPGDTFAPASPQVTVVIQVGQLDAPAPLSVTWYLVSSEGEEELFEHIIQVNSLDRAYSTGENPGLFAAGDYKTIVALGEATQAITWSVAQPDEDEAATASAAQGGAPPTSGSSGTVPPSPSEEGTTVTVVCIYEVDILTMPQQVLVLGSAQPSEKGAGPFACASLGELALLVSVGSSEPREVCSFSTSTVAGSHCSSKGNPCKLPGGADIPGTVINADLYETHAAGPGPAVAHESVTLSPDQEAPRVTLVTQPSNGAKVKAGDVIKVDSAIAEELKGWTWQTGVREIEVFVMEPAAGELDSQSYSEYAGKSCTAKSWKQKTGQKEWVVPEGLTEDIRICAFGTDFAGNVGKDCVTFHPGPKWTGIIKSETTGDYGSAGICVGEAWELQFEVVVSEDGKVAGSGNGQLVSMPQCSGAGFDGSELADQAHNVGFDVSGTFTQDHFELQFTETYIDGSTNGLYNESLLVGSRYEPGFLNVPLTSVKTADGQISTTFTGEGIVATGTHTVTMTCINCEEGVVSVPGSGW